MINSPIHSSRWKAIISVVMLSLIGILLLVYRLESWPSVWWDEGWTLDASRNWIEQGHLGHYLDGEAVPPRIPVRFPVLVPVAISMKILGVGIWQGRLPGVIFTIITIYLTVYLTSNIYNRRAGFISLLTTLIIIPFVYHPIVMGRQILAEMPMMFYLLAGYSMVWLAITRSIYWSIGAALFFGIAFHAKLQVPPFWLISMGLAAVTARSLRQHYTLNNVICISFGSIVVAGLIYWIQNKIMPGSLNDPALLRLLFNSVIVVLNGRIRLIAFIIVLLYSLPQFLSLLWAGKRILPNLRIRHSSDAIMLSIPEAGKKILQVGLWGLGMSWFLWYLLLALSWERYLFPPLFIGCIFFAAYLGELTTRLSFRQMIQYASNFLLHRGFNRRNFEAVILIVVIGITIGMIISSINGVSSSQDVNPVVASKYLSENIPPGSLVEMFESELLFLLPEFNFHFPSDLVSMQLNRRSSIDLSYPVDYDPLDAEPDYIVDGPMSRMWNLYDDVIKEDLFQLDANIGGYQIYKKTASTTSK